MLKNPSHVQVVKAHGAEHQLIARVAFKQGDVVVEEAPMLSIPLKQRYQLGSYTWDLVHAVLSDPNLLRTYIKAKLLASPMLEDPQDLLVEDWLVKTHRKSRSLVQSLFFGIGTNNIGILNVDRSVVGYGVYEALSRADHSCDPNTRLEPGSDPEFTAKLVAYRDIKAGEALTWSYFREDEFLQADFHARNYGLVNVFRFACRCQRCKQERPADLAGVKDLVEYYDKLIAEEAREMLERPNGLRDAMAASPMARHQAELQARGTHPR